MNIIFGFFLVIITFSAVCSHRCGQDEYMEHLYKRDSTLKSRMQSRETPEFGKRKRDEDTIYTIPVVVHIIYETVAQNLSDSIIFDQIARLNLDYRQKNDQSGTVDNFKSLAADSKIQFILAETDPNGQSTNGITRTPTTFAPFPTSGSPGFDNDCQKASRGGHDAWNSTRYMNVWVCKLAGEKLGFAQPPYGGSTITDGIVIDTDAFGFNNDPQYNLGRTLTHESGHWLNLKHPWGETKGECSEDDLVADTPIPSNETYTCDLTRNSCNNLIMVQNYMDYAIDNCMTLFTVGQVARMRAVLDSGGYRATVPLANYTGTPAGTDGNYTSPLGPLPGYKPFTSTSGDPSDGGITLDSFRSGTYLYILIAVAACVGLTLMCAIGASLRRCCNR